MSPNEIRKHFSCVKMKILQKLDIKNTPSTLHLNVTKITLQSFFIYDIITHLKKIHSLKYVY